MQNWVDYLKRHYHLFVRNRNTNLVPIKVHKADLQKLKKIYQDEVFLYQKKLEEYHENHSNIEIPVQNKKISDYEILSYNGDRMGKVILYNGEICRGIYSESIEDFCNLWQTGLMQILGDVGLIPKTEITPYYSDEYPMILHHERVEMSVSSLWNDEMILQASLLLCQLKRILSLVGYTLHDGHLNNVTFYKGKPVFTDIGSIVKDNHQPTICNREIVFTALYRILSNRLGNSCTKHYQIYDEDNNAIWVGPRYYDDMTREYQALLKEFKRYHGIHSSWLYRQIIRRVFEGYEVCPEYVELLFQKEYSDTDLTNKKKMEQKVLIDGLKTTHFEGSSCVVIGDLDGSLTKCLTDFFPWRITLIDAMEENSSKIYRILQKKNIGANTFVYNYLYGASTEKLEIIQSDLVIALDITETSYPYQRCHADSLLHSLAKLTRQYVAITYYPDRVGNGKYVPKLNSVNKEDTLDFERIFKSFYEIIIKQDLSEKSEGVLYIGKKK